MSTIAEIGTRQVASALPSPASSRGADFQAHVETSLATGRSRHAREQESESGTACTAGGATGSGRSLAQDARVLFGDLFGALGADTPTQTSARQAMEAYRGAG